MAYLYLDTSQKLGLGLFSNEEGWKHFQVSDIRKSSKDLHGLIDEVLNKNNLDVKNLNGVLTAAGPGSYTGLRLAEGMAQVFEMHKIKVFSFPLYDVPYYFDVEEGAWIAEAYKGQYFCYSWSGDKKEKALFSKEEAVDKLKKYNKVFSHLNDEISEQLQTVESNLFIEKDPNVLYESVIKNNMRINPIYFRELEDEFTLKEKKKK